MFLVTLLLLLACLAIPQTLISIFSLPDISGTGSAVVLSSSGTLVRWCQLVAPSTNSSNVVWGDSAITSSQGAIIAAGGGQFLPPGPVTGSGYQFYTNQLYVLVQSGDKVKISCAK